MSGPGSLVSGMPDPANSSDVRTGTVTAVTSRGISVAISGGSVDAAHLDSYAPAVGDTVALTKTQDSWLCLGRIVGSGTAVDSQSPGSGVGPSVLAAMHTVGTTTLATSSGSPLAVPKYNLTYYHPPGHSVLILVFFIWGGTVATDWIIVDFSDLISGATVGEWTEPVSSGSFGRTATVSALVKESFGGTKRTISMAMNRLTGTGSVSIGQNDTRPGYMIALDLGDKSVIVPT